MKLIVRFSNFNSENLVAHRIIVTNKKLEKRQEKYYKRPAATDTMKLAMFLV